MSLSINICGECIYLYGLVGCGLVNLLEFQNPKMKSPVLIQLSFVPVCAPVLGPKVDGPRKNEQEEKTWNHDDGQIFRQSCCASLNNEDEQSRLAGLENY